MPRRPCLDCGRLTTNRSRCDEHQAAWQARQDRVRGSAAQRGYDAAWRRTSAAVLARHRAQHGNWCPGWGIDPHPASDLTVDHTIPKSRGGSDDPANLTALCRPCNSRKHTASPDAS